MSRHCPVPGGADRPAFESTAPSRPAVRLGTPNRLGAGVATLAFCLALTVVGGFVQNSHAYGSVGLLTERRTVQDYVSIRGVQRRIPSLSAGLRVEDASARLYAHIAPPAPVGPLVTALGCSNRTSKGDIRVNQDCSYQRQAEESIAINPLNPRNMVVGQNDSVLGWNHCGYDYSLDGGIHWGSGTPPFYERTNHPVRGHSFGVNVGTGHTYDAASDPSVAFDSRGNSYIGCVLFDAHDNANGLIVVRSPAGADGSFFNVTPDFPPRGKDPGVGIVVEDNSNNFVADKDSIAADSYAASPYRDQVYAVWTEFISNDRCTGGGGQCATPIYFSRSLDHGVSWSSPRQISGNSRPLCWEGNLFDSARKQHDCDLDQAAEPIVLPNGSIVVVFNNANTAPGNPNDQQLAVVSHDGGLTWSQPALVGPDVSAKEPSCNFGSGPEQCAPGPYIRVEDFPQVTVDRASGILYCVWNDYRDGHYDIRLSRSLNGVLWKPLGRSVDAGSGFDDYMPAVGVSSLNHGVVVSYYTSVRVKGENGGTVFKPGDADIDTRATRYVFQSLPGGTPATGTFNPTPISPWFEPPNGEQVGFNGDYSGMSVSGSTAYPVWSDTRNGYRSGTGITFHDEDVFTKAISVP